MSKRTDCHRPGAIVPRDYVCLLSYSLPGVDGGFADPGFAVKEARELWMPAGSLPRGERFGSLGKCGVCGAHFRHGDIYRHEPTGHLVTMGHDCAGKYELVADRDDWSAALETTKIRRAAFIEGKMRDERLVRFCEREDFGSIFAIDHPILQDMREKVRRFGELSEKQVEFACKLACEAWCPERPKERVVPAPEGRSVVRGHIVSIKSHEGAFGDSLKMTVKVHTSSGAWLAWGTVPSGLGASKGDEIEFTATLQRGREEHFAMFKRPTKARVVTKSEVAA